MLTNCYIKSGEMNFYYWLGANGAWDSDKDTFNPDLSKYTLSLIHILAEHTFPYSDAGHSTKKPPWTGMGIP